MFDHMSRYYALATATLTTADGNVVTYVSRRDMLSEAAADPTRRLRAPLPQS